VKSA
jgi:hypothetical protein